MCHTFPPCNYHLFLAWEVNVYLILALNPYGDAFSDIWLPFFSRVLRNCSWDQYSLGCWIFLNSFGFFETLYWKVIMAKYKIFGLLSFSLELSHFLQYKALLSKIMMTFYKWTGNLASIFFFKVRHSNFITLWPKVDLSGLNFPGKWFSLSVCSFELSFFFFRKVFWNQNILVHILFYCSGFLLQKFVCVESVLPVFICHFL